MTTSCKRGLDNNRLIILVSILLFLAYSFYYVASIGTVLSEEAEIELEKELFTATPLTLKPSPQVKPTAIITQIPTVEIDKFNNTNSCLCGLVAFFNPTESVRRIKNFHLFSDKIRKQGVYLITIELYSNKPLIDENEYTDYYKAIKLDNFTKIYPLWQKERLFNVGLEILRLNEDLIQCQNVAWIDGEIIFKNNHWVQSTCKALEHDFTVLQPYTKALIPKKVESDKLLESKLGNVQFKNMLFEYTDRGYQSTEIMGYAWVARKKNLLKSKFYDRGIVGGGDAFFLTALENDYSIGGINPRNVKSIEKVGKLMNHYKNWAENTYKIYENKIGFPSDKIDSEIIHLWHGSRKNRRYSERWNILSKGDYDPETDVVVSEAGYLTWNKTLMSNVKKLTLINAVKSYFEMRDEDGERKAKRNPK